MTQPIKTLVVDDELVFRSLISRAVERVGHEVQVAEDGRNALQLMEQEAFDLVITDWHMPGMTGTELIARIREQRPKLPVIMITGCVHECEVYDEASVRADALLFKPFSIPKLYEAIDRVLAVAAG